MGSFDGQERRRTKRADLTTFCPTTFTHKGCKHKALMQNVSEHGARFRVEICTDDPGLAADDDVAFCVRTPYGESTCKGRVTWIDHIDERCTWGVEFTKLSDDPKDPLRCLIDSAF